MRQPVLFYLVGLFVLAIGFQNCSPKQFDFVEDASLTLATLSPPESSSPGVSTMKIDVAPQTFESGPIRLVVFFDDSKSNIVNTQNILKGIESLIDRLSTESARVEFYAIGQLTIASNADRTGQLLQPSKLSTTTHLDDQMKQTNRSQPKFLSSVSSESSNIGSPVAMIQSGLLQHDYLLAKQAALQKVQVHLEKKSQEPPSEDSTPTIECELQAYLATQNISSMERAAFVVITDEDGSRQIEHQNQRKVISKVCERRRSRKNLVEVSWEPESYDYLTFDYERRTILEGGLEVWKPVNSTLFSYQVPEHPKTCAEVTSLKLAKLFINQSNIRPTNATLSSCLQKTYSHSNSMRYIRSTTQLHEIEAWDGKVCDLRSQSDAPNDCTYDKVNGRIFSRLRQSQIFIGTFFINEPSEIKNKDQEVARNFLEFFEVFISQSNRRHYSVQATQYSKFVDDVLTFNHSAIRNRVDISSLLQRAGSSVQIKRVFIRSGANSELIQVHNFSILGSELVLIDRNIDASQGAQVQIEYSNSISISRN